MLSLAKFIKKEIELRENLVGTGFLNPPELHWEIPKEVIERDLVDEYKKNHDKVGDYRVTVMGKCYEVYNLTQFE